MATDRVKEMIEAGALVPPECDVPEGVAVDRLGARQYGHGALGDRVVVRLSPEALSQGDDLEMSLLGFGDATVRANLAKGRLRALGFPGWVLVHAPEHARYALDVVKDMKKQGRLARSKPGAAKEGLAGIAETLARTVPQFLPSYYEEVGRIFIDGGNTKYAGEAFNKAREAERVYALEVNEGHRCQAFLEFALAGAVTNKAMSEYAKELAKGADPVAAFGHFRELCLRRTLGGMPPYGAMANDLRKLAVSAGLNKDEEDVSFLEEILEAPSLRRAPGEFWISYHKVLVRFVQGSPRLRGMVLNLFPTPTGDRIKFDAYWLGLLDECKALDALVDPGPAEAEPTGGPAAWLSRMIGHVQGWYPKRVAPPALFALMRRMAKRLIADGKAVCFEDASGKYYYRSLIDLDLCDLALELGLPVQAPQERSYFDLAAWAAPSTEEERPRDPVYLAGDERFAPLLDRALDQAMGTEPFEKVCLGKRGLESARRSWLMRKIDDLASGGLPKLQTTLERLGGSASVQLFMDFPEAHERMRQVEIWPLLARTLQAGLPDELGWPALEEAMRELNPDGKIALIFTGVFPHLIVSNTIKAVVIGPRGREMDHDLQLPKGCSLVGARYVGGQMVVLFRTSDYKSQAYWSADPSDIFDVPNSYSFQGVGWTSLTQEDGGVTEGARAWHPGDRGLKDRYALVSDGQTFWRLEWTGGEHKLREYDPATGEGGRLSWPAFLEEFACEGMTIIPGSSMLLPAPEGLTDSPLGMKDGLLGWRVRQPVPNNASSAIALFEGIDGRRWEGTLGDGNQPQFLLHLPGDDRPRPVVGADLWDPEGRFVVTATDTSPERFRNMPIPLWNYFSPRDEAGSLALRNISDEGAKGLLDVAIDDVKGEDKEHSGTVRLMGELLPQLTQERLKDGVVRIIALAANLSVNLEKLVASRDPQAARAAQGGMESTVSDSQIMAALKGINLTAGYGSEGNLGRQIMAVSEFMEEGEAKREIPWSRLTWLPLVGRPAALAFRAVAPGTSPQDREVLLDLLTLMTRSPLGQASAPMRVMRVSFPSDKLPFLPSPEATASWLHEVGGSRYFGRSSSYYYGSSNREYTVLEQASEGTFQLLPEGKVVEERLCEGWESVETVERFVALARERGGLGWDKEVIAVLCQGTGLTRSEASLIWAGLPNIDDYQSNFLDKGLRTTMGLKVTEAEAGRQGLRQLTLERRLALLASVWTNNPEALWNPLGAGPDDETSPVANLVRAWNGLVGKRVPVPDDLLVRVGKAFRAPLNPSHMLAAVAAPAQSGRLNNDGRWTVEGQGSLKVSPEGAEAFDKGVALSAAIYLPYIFETLAVGEPLRANLPLLYDLVTARLNNPDLLLEVGSQSVEYDGEEKSYSRSTNAFLDTLGGEVFRSEPDVGGVFQEGRDNGVIVAVPASYSVHLFLRPEPLSRLGLTEAMRKLLESCCYDSMLEAVEFLGSEGLRAMMGRVHETPVGAGGWESNPGVSAPEVVREAMKRLELSEEGAVLYLQLLTLAAPTSKSVRTWNGWTAGQYKKAAAEVTAKGLVLEAKRARAGREHFLPCPWEDLKAPHLPLERWKFPLYNIKNNQGPLGPILPLEPLHTLFARAWERLVSGDKPSYEEIRR